MGIGAFQQKERLVSALGTLGAQGWELVAVYDKASNWLVGMEKGFVLFKRPVPEGEEPVGPWAEGGLADVQDSTEFDPTTGMPLRR